MKTLLVLGIGNILLKDEGVGVYCLQALESKQWPENVSFLDGGIFTQDIFCCFDTFDHLLVLDAVRGGDKPGTVYRLEKKDLAENSKNRLSLHEVAFLDSLAMAELSGKNIKLTVMGIEPEMIAWETGLTETLKKAFPGYVELVEKEILGILSCLDS